MCSTLDESSKKIKEKKRIKCHQKTYCYEEAKSIGEKLGIKWEKFSVEQYMWSAV